MSWWDTSKGLSSFASQALKSAQQKIDKVLDIKEGEGAGAASSSTVSTPSASSACTSASDVRPMEPPGGSGEGGDGGGEEFWNNWLGTDMGLGSSPFFSSKKTSKRTESESSDSSVVKKKEVVTTTTTKKTSKLQLKKQLSSSSSTGDKDSEKTGSVSEPAEGKFDSVSLTPVSSDQKDSSKPDSPSIGDEKKELNTGKKRAPLKLSLKSKSKEKLDKGKENETSSAVEEMLKREKEAEQKLLEMLGGDSAKESENIKITTKAKTDSEKSETVLEHGKPIIKTENKHEGGGERIVENLTKEPDANDVKPTMTSSEAVSPLTLKMSDSTASFDINQSDWGDANLLTDSQLMNVSFGPDDSQVTEGGDEKINEDKETKSAKIETTSSESTKAETPQSETIKTETPKSETPKNDTPKNETVKHEYGEEFEKAESVEDKYDKNEESEHDYVQEKESDKQDNVIDDTSVALASSKIDETLDMLKTEPTKKNEDSENVTDEKEGIPSVQSSCSMLSTLDGSLSSENVDDLSSSNQTLTADDFQSSVHSNKSSDKDNEEGDITSDKVSQEKVVQDNTGDKVSQEKVVQDNTDNNPEIASENSDIVESCNDAQSEDLPSVHKRGDTPGEQTGLQTKERSATMESNQSIGSTKSDLVQSPQSMTASHSSQCSSSSYVKNMLEEAMVESMKDLDSRSDSQSHSSSEMVRIESDQNSGHTSGDDLETATSSDIEIISHISTPTPNGENRGFGIGGDRPFDLSPLRHALNKAVRRNSPPGHRRTDSGSSAYSMQSKNGDDISSPTEPTRRDDQNRRQQGKNVSSPTYRRREDQHMKQQVEPNNDPYEKEKLLKEDTTTQQQPLQPIFEGAEAMNDPTIDPKRLLEKLAEMAEILEAREKKLVDLSRHNMDLVESNSILKNQLQQSEETREAEMTDLNQLTEEFTVRISDAERRFNQAAKECDQLKKKLQETETALIKRSDTSMTAEKLLKEKDIQINELMVEGEKLSKQQLQSNNVIKKLRSKEKENETLLKTQREKTESQKSEIVRLQKVLDNKCDVEKKQIESINQLQSLVQRQEKELEKYKGEWEDAQEKVRSMESALDSSYKEIAELHKANVTNATKRQEAALSQEMQAKQELQITHDRFQLQSKQEQEALMFQIEDLRLSMSRMEKEHGRREDVLRQEISDLQQRMQEGEDRNQELTSGVTAATRPLLRQIENLQSTYTAQSSSYEKVEKNLTDRLSDAQMQLATAQEKERVATENLMDIQSKVMSSETQLASLRQDKSRLQAQLEMEKTKVEVLEDAKHKESAQKENLQHSLESRLGELKKEKLLLENQLEMEKMKVESEKKKLLLAHEQIRDKELQLSQVKTVSRSSTPNDLRRESVDGPMLNSISTSMSQSFLSQSDDLEKSFVFTPSRGTSNNNLQHNSISLYESLRHTGAASIMENLQSQLKQKDGEIVQLQSEIHELERTRESMARELVNLTNTNEELQEKVKELPEAINNYKDLDGRYNALLQMYGEKVEEAQELRLDLMDVKDLYKNQIDELLRKS